LIDFPLQQWLQESASLLRYKNICCLDLPTQSLVHWTTNQSLGLKTPALKFRSEISIWNH